MNTNILLCLPKMKLDTRDSDWRIYPVGMAYVSSSLKAAGYNVYTLNLNLENDVHEKLRSIIEKHNIAFVGTGDIVLGNPGVKQIVDEVKTINSNIVTIIGGGLVTYSPVEAMRLIPNADYGVLGEGEITVCELIKTLQENSDIKKVNSVVYRSKLGG